MARSRWAARLGALSAARSKIAGERLGVENARLSRDVHLDPLTGLANRRGFDAWLVRQPTVASLAAVLLVDLDDFKSVNDAFGHAVGDEVLRQVARLVAGHVRAGDMALRLGGDEFAMVMTEDLAPDADLGGPVAADLAELARTRARSLRESVAAARLGPGGSGARGGCECRGGRRGHRADRARRDGAALPPGRCPALPRQVATGSPLSLPRLTPVRRRLRLFGRLRPTRSRRHVRGRLPWPRTAPCQRPAGPRVVAALLGETRDSDAGADVDACALDVEGQPRWRAGSGWRPSGAAMPRGKNTANSSPPMRAATSPARIVARRRPATSWRTRSPAWWPSVSLTGLKRSRSKKSSAAWVRGPDEGVLHRAPQRLAVGQPGEGIGERALLVVGSLAAQPSLVEQHQPPGPAEHAEREQEGETAAPAPAGRRPRPGPRWRPCTTARRPSIAESSRPCIASRAGPATRSSRCCRGRAGRWWRGCRRRSGG